LNACTRLPKAIPNCNNKGSRGQSLRIKPTPDDCIRLQLSYPML
jgi:hypothetical protein